MTTANPGTKVVAKIVFPVHDMAAALAFYRNLGFKAEDWDGYAWVTNNDDEVLHLALIPDLDVEANRAAGYWHVQDVDAWHSAWTAAGVDVGVVEDQPWSMREFVLVDPSGNRLRIGQNL